MNTTHYFLEKGQSTSQKSKLHQAIRKYFDSLTGTLIHAADFPEVKKLIQEKVEEFNKEFHRCKPVVLDYGYLSYDKSYHVTCVDGMYFYFRPATLSEPSTVTQYSISNN